MCKYFKNTHYVQIFRGIAQNSVGTVRFQKTSTQKKNWVTLWYFIQ